MRAPACAPEEATACLETLKKKLADVPGLQSVKPNAANQLVLDLTSTDGKPLKDDFRKTNIANCEMQRMYFSSSSNSSPTTLERLDKVAAQAAKVKEELVKKLGLKNWEDPDNPVGQYEFFYDSGIAQCRENIKSCSLSIYVSNSSGSSSGGSTPDPIEEFLKLDPARMDARDLVIYLKGRSFSASQSSSNTNQDFPSFEAARDQAIQEFYQNCPLIIEEAEVTAEATAAINILKNRVDANVYKNMGWQATSWTDSLKEYGKKCKALKPLMDGTDLGDMGETKVDVSDGQNIAPMKASLAKKLQSGKKSLVQGFKKSMTDYLANMKNYLPSSEEMPCTYDPFSTSVLAQKIAEESCVEQVFMPDIFVPIALRDKPQAAAKIVLDESDDKHFSVQIKGCGQIRRGRYTGAATREPQGAKNDF